MKKSRFIFLLPLFVIGACSSSDDTATQETSSANTEKAAPKKVSSDNPFSTQINALDTAKMVGAAAQKSIDSSQQKLEDAKH